jgi:hypothetical protein
LPNHPITTLAEGQITRSPQDVVSIELVEPDSMPPMVRITWPLQPTITTSARYLEVASTAMRLLAEASTTLARIKASRRH